MHNFIEQQCQIRVRQKAVATPPTRLPSLPDSLHLKYKLLKQRTTPMSRSLSDPVTDDHAKKKARFADEVDIAEEEDLGSEGEAGEEDEEGEEGEEGEGLYANDVIDVVFMDADDEEYADQPEYTHQLFDDEKIDFLADEEEEFKISVNIRCRDLAHLVTLPHLSGNTEKVQQLQLKLQTGIPEDSLIHVLSHNDESRDVKYPKKLEEFSKGGLERPIKMQKDASGKVKGPGKLVHTFSRPNAETGNTDQFELYLATHADEGATALLHRAEYVSKWYIETADSVDFSDDRWEVLFLFKRFNDADNSLSFSGYFTLFTFHNPLHGDKLRICQALILPILQKQRLGNEIMQIIYKLVESRSKVSEITVEDPAPMFKKLRDSMDYQWYNEHKAAYEQEMNKPLDVLDCSSKEEQEEVGKYLKITPAQVNILREALVYDAIEKKYEGQHGEAQMTEGGEEKEENAEFTSTNEAYLAEMRKFRLTVKRRVLSEDPELLEMPKTEMQKELEELYSDELARYISILKTKARLEAV
jgi:hypothetical protein